MPPPISRHNWTRGPGEDYYAGKNACGPLIRGEVVRMPETVLIVEDEAHVAGLLSDVLQAAGYQAVLTTGSRAAERARAIMPAVIVLDDLMPGLNGAEVVSQIRTSMLGDAPPMLLVTGLSNARELAEQGRFEGFLRKPFDVDAFVQIVSDLIARSPADR